MSVTLTQVEGFELTKIERFPNSTDAIHYALEYWHEGAANKVPYQPMLIREDETGEVVSTLISLLHDRTKVMIVDSTGYVERWSVWPIEGHEPDEFRVVTDLDEAWLS